MSDPPGHFRKPPLTTDRSPALWWRELGRLALDDEGYLWVLPDAGDEDSPARKLGHVEDDPALPAELAGLEAVKAWLAAERSVEPTRQELERGWRGDYLAGLI